MSVKSHRTCLSVCLRVWRSVVLAALLVAAIGCDKSTKITVSGFSVNIDVAEPTDPTDPTEPTDPPPTDPPTDPPVAGTFAVNADLAGVQLRPADSCWYKRVDALPVHPRSREIILATEPVVASLGRRTQNDWGDGLGIPYAVGQGFPNVPVTITAYPAESDHGPFPIPLAAPIEPGPDHHLIYFDLATGNLIEFGMAARAGTGFTCEASAVFHSARPDDQRELGWTSADAAGLPILPGLVRFDEFKRAMSQANPDDRHLGHALRFTLRNTGHAFIEPARHYASSVPYALPGRPPMGMRFRVKKTLDLSQFTPEAQVLLRTLQLHGAILADNGSNWFITGTSDPRWGEFWDGITGNVDGKLGFKSFAKDLFDNNVEILDYLESSVVTQL